MLFHIGSFCVKIGHSCIFQNLPQMQNRYPLNQWQEIIGNCDSQLFLGCTDEVTATFISNRSGDVTVGVSSEAKQLNSWRVSDYTPEYRQTRSIGKRKLLTPDEIQRLPLNKALIILRGQKILEVEKYDYTLHPDSKKLIPRKAADHVPQWRAMAEQEEYDYTPTLAENLKKKPRPGRSSRRPAFPSQEIPLRREPDKHAYPSGQPEELSDLPEEFPDYPEEIVPLDKDSIMS